MMQVNITEFRQNLPTYLDRVLAGEEFEVTRNRMSVAVVTPTIKKIKKIKRKIYAKAFGMWKDRKDWKGMSTIEIADMLREKAWKGNYAD